MSTQLLVFTLLILNWLSTEGKTNSPPDQPRVAMQDLLGKIGAIGELFNNETFGFCGISAFEKELFKQPDVEEPSQPSAEESEQRRRKRAATPIGESDPAIRIMEAHYTEMDFFHGESYSEKFDRLGISAAFQVAIVLGKTLTISGSGTFLNTEKTNSQSQVVTLMYKIQTMEYSLNIYHESLRGRFSDANLRNHSATHVVTGITWGANVYVSFEFNETSDDNIKDIEAALQATYGDPPAPPPPAETPPECLEAEYPVEDNSKIGSSEENDSENMGSSTSDGSENMKSTTDGSGIEGSKTNGPGTEDVTTVGDNSNGSKANCSSVDYPIDDSETGSKCPQTDYPTGDGADNIKCPETDYPMADIGSGKVKCPTIDYPTSGEVGPETKTGGDSTNEGGNSEGTKVNCSSVHIDYPAEDADGSPNKCPEIDYPSGDGSAKAKCPEIDYPTDDMSTPTETEQEIAKPDCPFVDYPTDDDMQDNPEECQQLDYPTDDIDKKSKDCQSVDYPDDDARDCQQPDYPDYDNLEENVEKEKKTKRPTSISISGGYEEGGQKIGKNFKVTVHGDIKPTGDSFPTTVEGAMKLLKQLPQLIKETNDGLGVPIKYQLTPISVFRNLEDIQGGMEKMSVSLPASLSEKIVQLFDHWRTAKQKLNDVYGKVNKSREFVRKKDLKRIVVLIKEVEEQEIEQRIDISDTWSAVKEGNVTQDALDEQITELWEGENSLSRSINRKIEELAPLLAKIDFARKLQGNGVIVVRPKDIAYEKFTTGYNRSLVLMYDDRIKKTRKDSIRWFKNLKLFESERNAIKATNNDTNFVSVDCELVKSSHCPNETEKSSYVKVYQNGNIAVNDFLLEKEGVRDHCGVIQRHFSKLGEVEKRMGIVLSRYTSLT